MSCIAHRSCTALCGPRVLSSPRLCTSPSHPRLSAGSQGDSTCCPIKLHEMMVRSTAASGHFSATPSRVLCVLAMALAASATGAHNRPFVGTQDDVNLEVNSTDAGSVYINGVDIIAQVRHHVHAAVACAAQ